MYCSYLEREKIEFLLFGAPEMYFTYSFQPHPPPANHTYRFQPTSHTHLLLTTPTSHTHRFHPLSTIVIHTLNFHTLNLCKLQREWVESILVWLVGVVSRKWVWLECIGVVSGCGCKDVYRFPHHYYLSLLLLICSFVSALFCSSIPTFFHF